MGVGAGHSPEGLLYVSRLLWPGFVYKFHPSVDTSLTGMLGAAWRAIQSPQKLEIGGNYVLLPSRLL